MTNTTTQKSIKKEIADVANLNKQKTSELGRERLNEKISEAINVLKVNAEKLTNKDVVGAIVSVVKAPAEQKFLAETLGLVWDKLKMDGAPEIREKEFIYAEFKKELADLGLGIEQKGDKKTDEDKSAKGNNEKTQKITPIAVEVSQKYLEKGIYLFSDYEDFKTKVKEDLVSIKELQAKEKKNEKEENKDEKGKEKKSWFAGKMDAKDPLPNRLSKMFPKEFKKGEWDKIEDKLDKDTEFKKEWENNHKAKNYEIDPKKGNAEYTKNLETIPRYEYDDALDAEGKETGELEYSKNANEYIEALKAGFQGSYKKYRELIPQSFSDKWGDKGQRLMMVLGNVLEKLLGPFRKYFKDKTKGMGKFLDSLGTKGKEGKMDKLNKKKYGEYYGEAASPVDPSGLEKGEAQAKIEKTLTEKGCKISNSAEIVSKASVLDAQELEQIVTNNAGHETALGVAMTPSENGGKEISFQSILLLNEAKKQDGVTLSLEPSKKDPTIKEVYGQKEGGKKFLIPLTDHDIFQTVVEEKEVKLEKVPDLKVTGIEEGKVVGYNETVKKFYDQEDGEKTSDKVSKKEVEMRDALTSETVREVLEKIDMNDEVAKQIGEGTTQSGAISVDVLQKMAKLDYLKIEENKFSSGLWSGDLKVQFEDGGAWYDFDTFEELEKGIDGGKIGRLAKEMDLPVEDLEEILDLAKDEFPTSKLSLLPKNFMNTMKFNWVVGLSDKADVIKWINSGKGQKFMNSEHDTLREYLRLSSKEKKEIPEEEVEEITTEEETAQK